MAALCAFVVCLAPFFPSSESCSTCTHSLSLQLIHAQLQQLTMSLCRDAKNAALSVPELLSLVLDWVDLPTLLVCARTARLWRDIALDHSLFSTEITLDTLKPAAVALFRARIAHKARRNATLELVLRFADVYRKPPRPDDGKPDPEESEDQDEREAAHEAEEMRKADLQAVLEELWEESVLPQWHRVGSAQIEVTTNGVADDLGPLWAVLCCPAPRMRMLHLDIRAGAFIIPADLLGGVAGAPLLHKMRLRGLQLPHAECIVPALRHVQELSLLQLEPSLAPLGTVGPLALLPLHFPHLSYLVLGGSHRTVTVAPAQLAWLRQLSRLETMCTSHNRNTVATILGAPQLADVSRVTLDFSSDNLELDSSDFSERALERFAAADGLRLTAKYDDRYLRSRAQFVFQGLELSTRARTAARRTFNVHQSMPWDSAHTPALAHCIVAPPVCARIVRLILKDPHWDHVCRFAGSLTRLESLQIMFRSPALLVERVEDTEYTAVVRMCCPMLRDIVVLCSGSRAGESRREVSAPALTAFLAVALDGLAWDQVRVQAHGFKLKFAGGVSEINRPHWERFLETAAVPRFDATKRSVRPVVPVPVPLSVQPTNLAPVPSTPSARTSPSPGAAELPASTLPTSSRSGSRASSSA